MICTVGVALLGCGNVGAAVAGRLIEHQAEIEWRTGVRYELRGIAVRNAAKPRGLPRELFTQDAATLLERDIDLVIECMGGTSEAAELVERALERGCHVVSANKDLFALHGPRLHALARAHGVTLRYEAAVCAAIPVLRILDESLAGDRIESISGIINGTCNAILSAMEAGAEFEEALRDAQAKGYAEADPRNDVEGIDAAHKLAILMQCAFSIGVTTPRISANGISQITKRDVARAAMLGYRIRLIATATAHGAQVAPVLVQDGHPFAAVSGPDNILSIVGRDCGELLMQGRGAGGAATASAILGDAISALKTIASANTQHRPALRPAASIASCYDHLRRLPELSRYPVWDTRAIPVLPTAAQAL